MNGNDRSIVGLVSVAHGLVHTYEWAIPILMTRWLIEFDATTALFGAVVAVGYALFGIGALPTGVLVDAIGSRRLIVGCLLGMGGSFLVLSLSPSPAVIAVALILWGTAASVYHPAGLALISKGVEERGSGFAYHGIAGNVGTGLGPLLTALMLISFDWRTAAAVLAIPALLGAVYAVRAEFDETAAVTAAPDGGEGGDARATGDVSSLSEFLADSKRLFTGGFVAVFGIVILSGLYYRGILTFLPELLSGFEALQVEEAIEGMEPGDYYYAGVLIIGVVGQYIGGKLTDRIETERGLAGAFLVLLVIALVFLPIAAAGLGPLLAIGALLGIFLFVVQPMYQATVALYTPPGKRGLSYGYTYLGVFGVGATGAAIAGGILAYADATTLFTVLAAFAALAALIAFGLSRRGDPVETR